MRWSLEPAAIRRLEGSGWSEKATLWTKSLWCCRTASGFIFFQPKIRTLPSQPAAATILPSPRIRRRDTPGLVSGMESWICGATRKELKVSWDVWAGCKRSQRPVWKSRLELYVYAVLTQWLRFCPSDRKLKVLLGLPENHCWVFEQDLQPSTT